MDADQFRKAAHAAVEHIISYNESLSSRPVIPDVQPGYLRPQLPSNIPETGEAWPAIQSDVSRLIEPGLTHWLSPNFMAFFPANVTYPSMLGELYSAAFNAPAFNWLCSPACTELETVVLDWMGRALSLPSCFLADESAGHGGGIIQGSASEAIVTAMVAGRERYLSQRTAHIADDHERQMEVDRLRGKLVALGSEQAHSATHKGANIAGTRYREVPVASKDGFAVRGATLKSVLDQCVEEGLEPYYLTVGFGTTTTCAVDAMDEIAEVLKEWKLGNIWTHVDAAYAGAILLLEEYKHYAKHFEAFDGITVNMTKWLLVNFDASCMWIKKRTDLTSALSISRTYLSDQYTDSGLVTDYRDWQIPLGRRFRALKIWFVLRTYGLQGLREHVARGIKFGELFADLVRSRTDVLSILTGPTFGLTVVTVVPTVRDGPLENGVGGRHGLELEKANKLTKEVYERICAGRELFLTSGMAEGVYAIRVVACNPSTTDEHIRRAFDTLVDTAEKVKGEAI